MPEKDDFEEAPPQAKRTGRESADPRNQPAEFADDLNTNRVERERPDEREKDEEK